MIFNQVCYRLDLFTYFFRMEQADDFVVVYMLTGYVSMCEINGIQT